MGYTLDCMRTILSELGINIIETIEYYDTKNLPVIENVEIENNIFELIKSNKEINT